MRKPSPSCTSSGGVRSSTSQHESGSGHRRSSPRSVRRGRRGLLRREGHLERAEPAGRHRVVDRVAPPRRADRSRRPAASSIGPVWLASSIASANEWRRRTVRASSMPAGVRADELELAEPQRREIGAARGDAGDDDASAGLRGAQRQVERALEPVHSNTTSTPPSRNSCPRSGVSFTACPTRRTAFSGVLRAHDLVGAGHLRGRPLRRVLRRHDHAPRLRERRSAISVSRPTVPAPTTSTSAPVGDTRAERPRGSRTRAARSSTAARRSMPSGTAQQLRAMGEHHAGSIRRRCSSRTRSAGPASGAPTVTRSHRPYSPCGAVLARLGLPACRAPEHARRVTTRCPAARSPQSSSSSPTTSWPGTNGSETSGEK